MKTNCAMLSFARASGGKSESLSFQNENAPELWLRIEKLMAFAGPLLANDRS